jgi:hypothetical protein
MKIYSVEGWKGFGDSQLEYVGTDSNVLTKNPNDFNKNYIEIIISVWENGIKIEEIIIQK